MDISDAAVVAIRPEPHLIEGTLPTTILDPICRWIQLNEAALIDLWNEEIDSVEFAAAIKKLDNARA